MSPPAAPAPSPSSSADSTATAAAPSPAPHDCIEFLSIDGGVHFKAARFEFHDCLNLLIGARGTGKSGVLHYIRFALGAPIPEAYAEEHADYVAGTLGTGTAVAGIRTRHGARYTWSCRVGEAPVVRDENGNVVSVSLGDIFAIEAYAQDEIEGIAKSPAAQLALIDRFAEADLRAIDVAIAPVERRIRDVATRRRRLADQIAEDAAREAELPSVTEALKGVALGGADAAARQERERAHEAKIRRGREGAAMGALAKEIDAVRAALDAFTRDALQRLSRGVEGDLERGPSGDLFRRTHAAVQRVAGALEGSGGHLRAELAAAERVTADEGRALAAEHAKAEEAYRALVVRDEADRARAAEGERLHRRFTELSAIAKRLGDLRRDEGVARTEQAALLAERARLLAEKSARRQRVCEEWTTALENEVRASLVPQGDRSAWVALFTDIMQGANIRPAEFVKTIAERIRPLDLVAMIEQDEIGPIVALDTVQKDRDRRARKILDHVRESGRVGEILLARLEDEPLIELRVGKRWRASRRLSPGQRCSCILLILLLRSGAPLLLDQAEDNIDGDYIYNVMVRCFSEAKAWRQLIVATLNPNPPALSGANRIFVLDVDEEGDGILTGAGPFEEVRQHVERLEGGREAFRRRGERYGLLPQGT